MFKKVLIGGGISAAIGIGYYQYQVSSTSAKKTKLKAYDYYYKESNKNYCCIKQELQELETLYKAYPSQQPDTFIKIGTIFLDSMKDLKNKKSGRFVYGLTLEESEASIGSKLEEKGFKYAEMKEQEGWEAECKYCCNLDKVIKMHICASAVKSKGKERGVGPRIMIDDLQKNKIRFFLPLEEGLDGIYEPAFW